METHHIENAKARFFSQHTGIWVYHPRSQAEEWSENLREFLNPLIPETDNPNFTQSLFSLFSEFREQLENALKEHSTSVCYNLSTGMPRRYFSFLVDIQYGQNGEADIVYAFIRRAKPMMIFRSEPQSGNETEAETSDSPFSIRDTVLFSTDAQGNYTFLGGSALKHLGMNPQKWTGRSIFEFLGDLPEHTELVKRIFSGKILVDKSQFGDHYFDDRFCPIYGSEGELLGITGIQLDVTEKVRAENELKKNTELLDNLFNSIPDNAYVLDKDFRIIRVNTAVEKSLPGMSLIGEQCYRIIHGRETPCEFCPVVETYETGQPAFNEYYEYKFDKYYELTCFPLRDKTTGQIIGATEFARDITVRKQMEESLLRSQVLLNELMEVLSEAVYLIDTDFTILRGNKAFYDMYPNLMPLDGRKCYETTIYDHVCPDCAAAHMFRTGKATIRVFYEKNSEDEPGYWLEMTAFPFYGMDNKISCAICIGRDITPKVQMENQLDDYKQQIQSMTEKQMQELRISEAKLRTILETSGAAISFADHQGRLTYINGMYKEMLGYSDEELLGQFVTCIVSDPKDVAEETERINDVLHNQSDRYRFTGQLKCKNGDIIWGDIYVSVIHGIRPEDTQLISVVVDVTAQQQLVEHLNRAKMAAEEASLAKSQFLATMSHEIRTPLNGVIGVSNLLMETPLQPKQLEYAKLIKVSGESLLFLINDILDFSKIEAGKFDLDQAEFIVHDLVESVLRILASRASEKQLELVATFDSRVPGPVIGDLGRLRQILVNLIGNALKFTEQGGVMIHVGVEKLLEPDHILLKFSVRDTGIGIPQERQNRLFKSFSQVDASSARNYGGTGLGLAISKKLVELMDGEIHVESTEGIGSTFWFTACFECDPLVLKCLKLEEHPCITEEIDNCQKIHLTQDRCARSGRKVAYLQKVTKLGGQRVLLVDPQPIKKIALFEQMQNWKMLPQVAETPEDALSVLNWAQSKGEPFRLIVVEVMLQNSSSMEQFIREVQDEPQFKDTVIIVLTPLSADWQRKTWKEPQKIRFVSKPVCCSTLLDSMIQLYFEISSLVQSEKSIDKVSDFDSFKDAHRDATVDLSAIKESLQQNERVSSGPIRVLVAEDNTINQIVISEILKKAAMEYTIAENGIKAVEIACCFPFDIILMDCQMPQMDGYEATRTIRQWEKEAGRLARIPIIALTANATSEDKAKCLDAGMDAYCSKPVEASQLLSMIYERTRK